MKACNKECSCGGKCATTQRRSSRACVVWISFSFLIKSINHQGLSMHCQPSSQLFSTFTISLCASSLLDQNAAAKVICMTPFFGHVTRLLFFQN